MCTDQESDECAEITIKVDFVGLVLASFPAEVLIQTGYDITYVQQEAAESSAIFNNLENVINGSLLGCN